MSGLLPLYHEGRSICNQHACEHVHQGLVQVGMLQMEIQHRKWLEKAWVGTEAHRICLHNHNHHHLFVIKGDSNMHRGFCLRRSSLPSCQCVCTAVRALLEYKMEHNVWHQMPH